jgi:hypothetical protein
MLQDRYVLTPLNSLTGMRCDGRLKWRGGTGAEESRQIMRMWRLSWGVTALGSFFGSPSFVACSWATKWYVVEQAIEGEIRRGTIWYAKSGTNEEER